MSLRTIIHSNHPQPLKPIFIGLEFRTLSEMLSARKLTVRNLSSMMPNADDVDINLDYRILITVMMVMVMRMRMRMRMRMMPVYTLSPWYPWSPSSAWSSQLKSCWSA